MEQDVTFGEILKIAESMGEIVSSNDEKLQLLVEATQPSEPSCQLCGSPETPDSLDTQPSLSPSQSQLGMKSPPLEVTSVIDLEVSPGSSEVPVPPSESRGKVRRCRRLLLPALPKTPVSTPEPKSKTTRRKQRRRSARLRRVSSHVAVPSVTPAMEPASDPAPTSDALPTPSSSPQPSEPLSVAASAVESPALQEHNTVVFTDTIGKNLGPLLGNKLMQKVTNICMPGASFIQIVECLLKMKYKLNTTIVLLIGNSHGITHSDLIKYLELMLPLSVRKIIICEFPYSEVLTESQKRNLYCLNMCMYNFSVGHSDKVQLFDTNIYIRDFVLTEGTMYLANYYKKQLATQLARILAYSDSVTSCVTANFSIPVIMNGICNNIDNFHNFVPIDKVNVPIDKTVKHYF